MKTIKTRSLAKSIKVLDKSYNLSMRMKNVFNRTKRRAEETHSSHQDTPAEYAGDRVQGTAQSATQDIIHRLPSPQRQMKECFNRTRERNHVVEQAPASSQPGYMNKGIHAPRKMVDVVKTAETTATASKSTVKNVKVTAKGTIKTSAKTVKTAERSLKVTVKTSQQAAKSAKMTAQASAKTAKAAAHAARVAAKAAAHATKTIAKAVVTAVKAIIEALSELIALIVAGSWVAVLIIVVICMVGLLVASAFGIFLPDDSNSSAVTLKGVVAEIDAEYNAAIGGIAAANSHDLLDTAGVSVSWNEVLAVYAVATALDPNNPMEVSTMDDAKADTLRSIFGEMHSLSYSLGTVEIEVPVIDADGVPTGEVYLVVKTALRVFVVRRSPQDMAVLLGFSAEQGVLLKELLGVGYERFWVGVMGSLGIIAIQFYEYINHVKYNTLAFLI